MLSSFPDLFRSAVAMQPQGLRFGQTQPLQRPKHPTFGTPPTGDRLDIRFGEAQTVEQKAKRFADYHSKKLGALWQAFMLADFDYLAHGGEERLQAKQQKWEAFEQSRTNPRVIRHLQDLLKPDTLEQIHDPVLRRTLQVMADEYYPKELLDKEMQAINQKLEERGTRLEDLYNVRQQGGPLAKWTPPDSKQTYGEMLIDLTKARNEAAVKQGFSNFYDMTLARQGFDLKTFDGMLKQLKSVVDRCDAQLEERFTLDDRYDAEDEVREVLTPYLRKLDPETAVLQTVRMMGQPSYGFLSRSDLFTDPTRPGKTKHCFCVPVNPPDDVRPISNLPANPDALEMEDYESDLLHETTGHRMDFGFLDKNLPAPLRGFGSFDVEAQAVMFETLLLDEKWLSQVAGVPPQELKKISGALKLTRLSRSLESMQGQLRRVTTERALFRNPDGRKKSKYWANVFHYANYPAYYHNYLLGQAWRAQVMDTIAERFGHILTPETGNWLKEHRSTGKLYPWAEQIERMTGQPLSVDALQRELESLTQQVLAEKSN